MPTVRLIEKSDIPRSRRHRDGRNHLDWEEARAILHAARDADQAVELTLEPSERAETIKLHYRAVAKEEGLRLRFRTAASRERRTRRGRETTEAAVLLVRVARRSPAGGA